MITGTFQFSPPGVSDEDTSADVTAVNDAQSTLIVGPVDAPYDLLIWGTGSTALTDNAPEGIFLGSASFGLYIAPSGGGSYSGEAPPSTSTFPASGAGLYLMPDTDKFALRLQEGDSLYAGIPFTVTRFNDGNTWQTWGAVGQLSYIGNPAR